MDWTNDMVLEFLQVFATEPIIWDPKHPEHKKKHLLAEAWIRINNTLNWQCTVEDLKKKRDSLMAYYRIHLNKIRKLKTAGRRPEDDYKTNWFAFEAMNSFLGNIYDNNASYITEGIAIDKNRPIPESTDSAHGTEYLSDSEYQPKRKRREVHTVVDQVYSKPEKDMYECEMYAQLLVHKLKKLDEEDRLILMNKIDNLVFQTTMESKTKKRRTDSSINISSINQGHHLSSINTNADPIQCHSPTYYEYRDIPSPSYEATEPTRDSRAGNCIAADSSHSLIIISNKQSYPSNQSTVIKEES